MDGYYGDGYEDGFGDGDDDGYYGEGDGTRDFLSQPISSGGTYPVPRVDMAALDLNSEGPVGGFRGLLHSGGVPQGINLSTGSPPFYFRGGGRTLGLRGHRPATVGRSSSSVAGAGRGAVAPPLPARAATSDVPEGSRSRPARPRSPTTAGAEDSSNNNSNAVEDVEILTNNPMDIDEEMGGSCSSSSSSSSSSSDDEFTNFIMEDDGTEFTNGMLLLALHIDKYMNRSDYRVPLVSGLQWVERKLADRDSCYKMFRMSPTMFSRLHDMLVNSYGLKSGTKSTSVEALGVFLWMVGAPQSVRQADDRFEHSLGTIHNNFQKVLNSVCKLAVDVIKPQDPEFRTIHRRLLNPRFTPFFDNCIGAIDGTHILVIVPANLVVQYMCRKNCTTQNVMAVCDFDMRFTFVLAGWPGSVHDMRVFNDAMEKWGHKFPHPPKDKFYLVDSSYPNRQGYLAPYKGTKYHLPEYQGGPEPKGKQELFNFAHSSLRNVVERSFGVLKMKWRILLGIPSYPLETQTKIIVACMALHNFIRTSGVDDRDFALCDRDENFVPQEATAFQPHTTPAPTREDTAAMNTVRETIANSLFNRS